MPATQEPFDFLDPAICSSLRNRSAFWALYCISRLTLAGGVLGLVMHLL